MNVYVNIVLKPQAQKPANTTMYVLSKLLQAQCTKFHHSASNVRQKNCIVLFLQ